MDPVWPVTFACRSCDDARSAPQVPERDGAPRPWISQVPANSPERVSLPNLQPRQK